ncbi:hypothetical protein [Anaerocolumna sp.]|uniref:hypothetical protein n=1 Tax=Anaerocolumna sp. TaxID=2041569 RepID=UPI0028A7E808|nr:hypothetical protein [Anaerocolumna sp.]
MDTKIGQSTLREMLPGFIILAVLLLFIIFCIKMLISTSKARKEGKSKLQTLKNKGMTYSLTARHTSGLPIAENTQCTICSYPDRYEISANGAQFNLSKAKVNDVSLNTDVEIQKRYVSSAGGAIGGAALFGPLGAMIGGRVKEKKDKIEHTYLIFTYTKDNTIDYIGFDTTGNYNAVKFVSEFRNMNSGKEKVVTNL